MKKLSLKLSRKILTSFGFVETNYESFAESETKNQLNGFKMEQVTSFENNINSINKFLPKNHREFYIVKLENRNFQIRAWGVSL